MARSRRGPNPVSSFSEELMAALLKGCREKLTIPLGDEKAAMKLRHRIHELRSAMRKEDHPSATLVERAQLSVRDGNLVIFPKDSQFAAAIRRAGVAAKPLGDDDPLKDF